MEIDPAAAWNALEAGAPELAARGAALSDALKELWLYLERAEPL
jgi:uncharacterized YccA/Bax inhibitor family protein